MLLTHGRSLWQSLLLTMSYILQGNHDGSLLFFLVSEDISLGVWSLELYISYKIHVGETERMDF